MTAIPEFTDPRLVAVYDALNQYPRKTQPEFYAQLARDVDARLIVDLGCGTGLITRALAAAGHGVIGVDPNRLMLDVARRGRHGDHVRWIEGGAHDIGVTGADLAIMTGHVAQFFVRDDEWSSALAALRAALRTGGRLAFETRNPGAREWEHWTRERARTVVDPTAGPIETWTDVHDVRAGVVSCTTHYVFAASGEELVSPVQLRFHTRDELAASLAAAGFELDHLYGDWDRRPAGPTTPELIVVATTSR